MIEQHCFCGEVQYQVFAEYVLLPSERDSLRFVLAVGRVTDPNKMLHHYKRCVDDLLKHVFCSQCGCPIYQIDRRGYTKYCIRQISHETNRLYSGAMQFGL
jgi:hypothetical protein